MKDNRVDNFCKVFGFEYDAASGLYLPEGLMFSVPQLEWQPAKPYYGTAARTTEPQGLTFDSLTAALIKFRELAESAEQPPKWIFGPTGFDARRFFTACTDNTPPQDEAETMLAGLDAWLEASEAEYQ